MGDVRTNQQDLRDTDRQEEGKGKRRKEEGKKNVLRVWPGKRGLHSRGRRGKVDSFLPPPAPPQSVVGQLTKAESGAVLGARFQQLVAGEQAFIHPGTSFK